MKRSGRKKSRAGKEKTRKVFEDALLSIAECGEPFTCDDVYDYIDGMGWDTSLVGSFSGSIFASFSGEGIIQKTGKVIKSRRNASHLQHEWVIV